MHTYLRAIGFSNYNTAKSIRPLLDRIIDDPEKDLMIREGNTSYGHLSQSFGQDFGLRLYVEYEHRDPNAVIREDHYFPYADSYVVSSVAPCTIEQRVGNDSYCGMCEETNLGISLIFFLSNSMEYLKRKQIGEPRITGVALTALSIDGKVLLPLAKSKSQRAYATAAIQKRSNLLDAARSGDETAMESLAMDDMAIMQQIDERIDNEDVYTMVDSYFMPSGLESDRYSILGEILTVETVENTMTGERMYRLLIECNDIRFRLLINRRDMLGEPAVGRRFKGDIWMQGKVLFGMQA